MPNQAEKRANKVSRLWSDRELNAAVSAYLFMLLLQQSDAPESTLQAAFDTLVQEFRGRRNRASLHFRLRNISSVLSKSGWPVLHRYSPARNVGTGVSRRIRGILASHPLSEFARKPRQQRETRRSEITTQFQRLDDRLDDLRPARLGHNHPPEDIDGESLPPAVVSKLQQAVHEVAALVAAKPQLRPNELKRGHKWLVKSGLAVAKWLGERATKAVDAAIALYILILTGIVPQLASALAQLGHALIKML